MGNRNSTEPLDASVYDRAQRFLPWNASIYVTNIEIDHHWIRDTDSFWYRQAGIDGQSFVIFDCRTGERRSAFDHDLVAKSLAGAVDEAIDPANLPFKFFEFSPDDRSIRFRHKSTTWDCGRFEPRCISHSASAPAGVVSPDGNWVALLKSNDIWIWSL